MQNSLSSDQCWFAVSGSTGLENNQVNAVKLNNNEIAIWRNSNGELCAVENRCAHRGVRLSLGYIASDRLVCRYHGWQYDTRGQCKYTPAQPEFTPPKSLCVKRYDICESHGLVWILPSDNSSNNLQNINLQNNNHKNNNSPLGKMSAIEFQRLADGAEYCRSVYIDADVDAILKQLHKSCFLPLGITGSAPGSVWQCSGVVDVNREGGTTEYQACWSDNSNDSNNSNNSNNSNSSNSSNNLTVHYTIQQIDAHNLSIEAAWGEGMRERLVVALQPINENKTAAHIVCITKNLCSGLAPLKLHYDQWARQLRDQLANTLS
jgi:nitrite reductase/ring-hydroxylating ferredoxin subunit